MDCICSSDDGQIALEKESKAGKKSLAGSLAEQKYGIRQDLSDSISAVLQVCLVQNHCAVYKNIAK
jgi:hypothetical protein